MISVAIIEDIKAIREPLFQFISSQPEFFCEISAVSVEEFFAHKKIDYPLDVILLDIGLPGLSGLGAINLIKEKYPEINIIMLTVFDDAERIFQAMQSGAVGYLIKNTPLAKIKEAIIDTSKGGTPLSPNIARKIVRFFEKPKSKIESPLTDKEKQIVAGMVDGQSFKMIAANLGNTLDTIKSHTKNIYRKLYVNSKAEVITKSMRGEI
ncbi:MAG: DNA-binding response regulator [Ignavibacteriales bacterium CG18_big_fil_WC_8_21_14_2_50_31_20]|nr:MAG: DNA-binding response regulator [Ignavibacteriales bacterium CG18_big_fil_WC_8_21_14_2_50_31_20]